MWWTYTATTGGTTQVSIISANDGSGPYPNGGIWVWETSASTIAAVEASPVKANAYRANATTFNATKGQTYKVRIGTTYNEVANFRVRVETGPGNDNVSDAVSINALSSGQSYTSPDWTNALAGKEAGENDDLSSRGLWWAYTATTTGSVRVSVIADSTGATLPRPSTYAWDSTATTASQVQTGTRYGDWGTSVITFPVTAGKTYKIRVGNVYGDLGKFRLKLDAL
ncbi:hypothetical protein [Paenarthrobacter sp. C1]|uniref:hypothetical protein n=1 Tax=Paenarthrobacter sp. C1 TaxID=3400220 RepID=UPI003BF5674A